MRRFCFAEGCTSKPQWRFVYDGRELLACKDHMLVAVRTSRQVMVSRRMIYRGKKEATQELPAIQAAVS